MPCTDGGPSYEQTQEPLRVAAVLCGILSLYDGKRLHKLLDLVDWQEVGVTRKWAEGWWAEHQEQDARRREVEARKAETKRKLANVLAKLTDEERRLLGVRG